MASYTIISKQIKHIYYKKIKLNLFNIKLIVKQDSIKIKYKKIKNKI